jgi:hypothetical protein
MGRGERGWAGAGFSVGAGWAAREQAREKSGIGKEMTGWLLDWIGSSWGLGWVFLFWFSFLILILTQTNQFEFKQNLNSNSQSTQANKINAPA